MRKLFLLLTLAGTLLASVCAEAQDFSNKGRDFWVGYGYHQVMNSGNSQDMVLYFATEYVTTVTVSIPGIGYSQTYPNIPAGTVFATNPIPKNFPDARLTLEGYHDKGINIKADKAIVAYAHIYNQSVSGATILYPTNTLGKEYYSVNYSNISNTPDANCWFYVIAADTGTTTVEIVPTAATMDPTHTPGTPFTVTLNQGQIYNVMGTTSGNTGVDLTGSTIKSVSSVAGGCKRIAVFSGSGRIAISCNGTAPSSDNYMTQAMPKTAWGKNYLTVPSASYTSTSGGLPLMTNFYRVCVQNPTTQVFVDGAPIAVPLTNGFYYSLGPTSVPMKITADQPILVAQYFPSQGTSGCGTANGDGDPEVIYLSPVEQSISVVRWNACHPFRINQFKNYINVIIPNGGTAISSLMLDGAPVNPAIFTPHPTDPNYSYAVINVAGSPTNNPATDPGIPHVIQSDSGFNAIAYGYGAAESYGYNAGTNIIDLYQFIQVENPYATVNFPAACEDQAFNLSIVFPYIPTQIDWDLTSIGYGTVTVGPSPGPIPDSTWIVNGKPVYRFTLPTSYTVFMPGTYNIQVTAQNPTPDNCSGIQEINYDLQVFSPPSASFNFTGNGCLTDSVHFFGTPSNTGGRPIATNSWNFGDATTSGVQNPVHLYTAPGSYLVKYSVITDVGCLSDTTTQFVSINNPPVASFSVSQPACVGQNITFIDQSNTPSGTTITNWAWNFGDGSPVVNATNGNPQSHPYATAGNYTVTLTVTTNTGCQSLLFSLPVTINPKPVASFSFGGVCLPNGSTQFTDQSTIPTGGITQWAWNFGDGGTSTQQNPVHVYTSSGPFNVTLTVTSNNGCTDDTIRVMDQVYAQPHADFNVDSITACHGGTFNFTDISNAPNSSVTQWFWDFGDATTSTLQNPNHTYAAPGTYIVRHWVVSAASCMSDTMTRTLTVVQSPTAGFTVSNPLCATQNVQFTSTSVANAGTITQYNWTINGSPTGGNTASINYTPATAGNYTVILSITTSNGCTAQSTQAINIPSKPLASFNFGGVCLPNGSTQFTDQSTISGGTVTQWTWNFGDGGTSTQQNPVHVYLTSGPFNVTLTVTSNTGCTDDTMRIMDQVYAQPHADFNADSLTACLGGTINFTDNSNAPNSTVTQWFWEFGDGGTSTQQNPNHSYTAPGTYTVRHWIISAASCMSDTMTKTITVLQLPTAGFTVSNPLCAGQSAQFTSTSAANAGSITQYNWTINGAPTGGNNSTINYTPVAGGNYTVILSVTTNNGCTSQVTQTITVNARPLAAFSFTGACLPSGSTQFTDQTTVSGGSVTQWSWNFGDGGTSTQQNPNHPYASSGPFNVTLTVTSNNGCVDDTVRVMDQVFAQPHADFNTDSITSCLGGTVNFTDNSNAPNSTVTQWFWEFGDGGTSTLQNPNHSYAAPGTYTVRHWIISAASCMSDTMTKTVTVLQLPTASFTISNPVCETQTVLFTSTSSANVGTITQYSWTVNGSPTGGNTSTLNYAPPTSGNYNITLTITTNNGCNAQSTQVVNVRPAPVANFTLPNVCLPSGIAQFNNTSTISDGSQSQFVYAWDFGDGGTAGNIANPVHTYTSAGPFNVTLIVTSANGCVSDTIKALTTIYSQPQAAFNAPAEVCNGTTVNFTDQSTAPNSSITQWSWNFGDGGTSTQQNPTHAYAATGSFVVTLTTTSAVGCPSTTATRTVLVNPLPTANFNASVPNCINQGITFTDISVANAGNLNKWTWNFGDGGTSTQQNPQHTYTTAGVYNVTLLVETDKGCVSTLFTKAVTVSIKPVANFGLPVSCLLDPFSQFTDSSSISTGSITQWAWSFGDGGTSTQQNPQHTYTAAGPYNVTLTVTSNTGCATTITRPFFVNGAVPVPLFTVQGSTTFCSGGSISLTDNSSVNPGNIVKLEVYWDYTNDPTIKTTDNNPAPGKSYSHNYPEFGTPANKIVTIRYVVYSGQTCVQYIDRLITLNATPTIQFNAIPGICEDGASFQITQAAITNGLPGNGVYSGPGVSSTGLFNPGIAGDGTHTLRYTYTTSDGCINYKEQTMEVFPKPVANAGPDKVLIAGGSVMLTPALNSGFPVTYLWSPPDYLDNPNSPTPKSTTPADITYTLTVTSDKGCSDTDQVFVKQLKKPLIPNIFSPNGDGIHDKWDIPFLNSYPGCTIDIYNRYGQLVYHSIGYDTPWDGTVKGNPVPVGTYYYIIDPKNGAAQVSGYVDVIR